MPIKLQEVPQPNNVLQAYVGKYKEENKYLPVEQKQDGSWLILDKTAAWKMYFTDAKHFFVLENSAKFSTLLDGAGKAYAIGVNNQPIATRVN